MPASTSSSSRARREGCPSVGAYSPQIVERNSLIVAPSSSTAMSTWEEQDGARLERLCAPGAFLVLDRLFPVRTAAGAFAPGLSGPR